MTSPLLLSLSLLLLLLVHTSDWNGSFSFSLSHHLCPLLSLPTLLTRIEEKLRYFLILKTTLPLGFFFGGRGGFSDVGYFNNDEYEKMNMSEMNMRVIYMEIGVVY